jgi:hypothetical protein
MITYEVEVNRLLVAVAGARATKLAPATDL